MSWILFSILAALVWSFSDIIDKYILTKWIKRPNTPLIVTGIFGLLAGLFVYLFQGFSLLSYLNIILAFVAGSLYILSIVFYFKAAKIEEISRVIPLFYLTPLFVLILAAIFLGEVFTPIKYLGIFLLVIGAVLISSKKLKKIGLGKSFWFLIVSSLLWAVSLIITKYLLNFSDFWTIFAYTRIGTFISTIPILYFNFPDLLSTVKKHGQKVIGLMSLGNLLVTVGGLLVIIAMTTGYVTLINALSSLEPFFVLFFAVILSIFFPKFLKEEIRKSTILIKLLAITLVFVGAILIT